MPIGSVASVAVSTVDKKSYDGEVPVRLVNYTDVYYNDRILPGDYMPATATKEQIRRFSVRAGDVAITKDSETSNDIGIPAFAPRNLPDHVWGYHLAIYRARDPRYGRFLKWFFEAAETKAELEKRTPGVTRVGLGQVTLRYLRVARPTPDEAQSIADYLDKETAEIDAFITDQEQLIALLDERRLSVLGVALDAPGWRRGNIRAFARMRTGHTPSRSTPEYWLDTEVPWFTLADVWQLREGRQYVRETNERISALGLANSAAELLPAGTVMLSRTASVGFTGIMHTSMATSQDFWNWVPGPHLRSEFLWYQLQAMRPYFMSLVQGSTHKTIYQADAASLMVSVPTLEEQDVIISRLNVETTSIDAAVADARAAIALSKERRAALISAAVTGRIDVAERKRELG